MDLGGIHEVIKYTPSPLPGSVSDLFSCNFLKGQAATIRPDVCTSNLIVVSFDFLLPVLSAKHYDVDTTEPISCSLQTLEQLLLWKRSEANPFNVATVPLAPREPTLDNSLRRTLVSHDMMGGYLDDRCGMQLYGLIKPDRCFHCGFSIWNRKKITLSFLFLIS